MKKTTSHIIAVLAFALMVGIDQLTKFFARTTLPESVDIIKGVLRLTYVKNTGAAWGIFAGRQIFFIVLTLIMLVAIVYIYLKTPHDKKYLSIKTCLVTLAAGAVGNLIDRIYKGYVDDFIDFHIINFPVFNYADICVCISMILLVIAVVFQYKDNDFAYLKSSKKESESEVKDGDIE